VPDWVTVWQTVLASLPLAMKVLHSFAELILDSIVSSRLKSLKKLSWHLLNLVVLIAINIETKTYFYKISQNMKQHKYCILLILLNCNIHLFCFGILVILDSSPSCLKVNYNLGTSASTTAAVRSWDIKVRIG